MSTWKKLLPSLLNYLRTQYELEHMCDQVNAEVLNSLTGEQYNIVAEDSVDCLATLLQKVKQRLTKYQKTPLTLLV